MIDNAYLIEKCSKEQLEQFKDFYKLLIEWNEKVNLTAITEEADVYLKHFVDSIILLDNYDFTNVSSIIDVGCGAGFPSIPLKIMLPDTKFLLLDSLKKRVNFLNLVIEKLNLKNITAIHQRAEDAARNDIYREQFDLCVSRAVANLSTLSEYCLPFVKPNGKFIPYKSKEVDEEIKTAKKAINILGGQIVDNIKIQLPNSDLDRAFVIISKEKNTPKKYPRKSGMPAKMPLA